MDIKILRNVENSKGILINENLILEKVVTKSQYEGIDKVNLFLFDIVNQTNTEILPSIEKYSLGKIINVSVNSNNIYFINIFNEEKDNPAEKQISIIRYNYISKTTENVLTFYDDISLYEDSKRLKLFILNDMYVIMQHEFIRASLSGTYFGYFDFELMLYNIKDETIYSIVDENLSRNGIDTIIPIAENLCVMKTGFSLLTDSRYNELSAKEVSIEGISFINISQLVSDMLISKTNIIVDTIDQAFFKKTFPYIKKIGNYIIYSCLNNETKEEEIIFYNYLTKETKNCINKNVIRVSDLALTYILDDEPYICIKKQDMVEFVNIKTSKVSLVFNTENEFVDIINNTFIFKGVKERKIFNKNKQFFELYGYPGQTLLLHENQELLEYFSPNKDNLYIFIK